MVKGNGTSKPYVSFIGNSSVDVTGSMHLIRFKKYVSIFDCGLIQLNDPLSSHRANAEQLKKIKPTEIDYIFLSHCHIDHSGLIPALFARGCHAHVYVPTGSIPFLKLLWYDSMKIMQSDCLKMQNKHGVKVSPFYNEEDIEKALNRCIEVNYESPYKINSDMEFTYYSAGHIIHSAQIYLVLKQGSIIKRVGYTGDIGGNSTKRYIDPKQTLPFCDVLIGENTYNIPTRPNKPRDKFKDMEKISSVASEYNKILIPVFSLQRCQELVTLLYEMWEASALDHDIPIYIDSPLAQKICAIWDDEDDGELWNRVWHWKNLHVINEWAESVALQNSHDHCIILCSSGFLNGGRVVSHLKTVLPNRNNHILFVGYAGENNLASQIKEGQKQVIVDGESIDNLANITELRSFSSHANYEELMEYYSEVRFNKLAIVHGEYFSKVEFCKTLQNKLSAQNKTSKVVCVNSGQRLFI